MVKQFQKCLLVAFVLEVQNDALLAPIDAHEIGALAVHEGPRAPGHVSALGTLHLNHLSPEVGHDHRCIGPGEHPRKIENFHTILVDRPNCPPLKSIALLSRMRLQKVYYARPDFARRIPPSALIATHQPQKVIIAGDPRHSFDELLKRGALLPHLPHLFTDGTHGSRTVGVGAVEGEIGLVQLAQEVAVFGKGQPTSPPCKPPLPRFSLRPAAGRPPAVSLAFRG